MSFFNISLPKMVATGCMTALLGITAGCVSTPYYDGHGKYDGNGVYRDGNKANFGHVSQELRARLERSGYKVMDVRKVKGNNDRILAHARRNNQDYEMIYTYPSLRLVSGRAYDRSNGKKHGNKHNNGHKHDKGHKHGNKHH